MGRAASPTVSLNSCGRKDSRIKTVFITGGSRGIGRAIVERFAAAQGYQIAFTFRDRQQSACDVITSCEPEAPLQQVNGGFIQGKNIIAVQMDLLQPDSIKSAMDQVMNVWGAPDIVVHNAGFCQDTPFCFMEEDAWTNVIQCSLNSFFHINQRFLPNMIEKRSGRVIVLASISGQSGNRGQVNYSAAKGALISASKALAKEVARKGVLVNVVSPGLIATEMVQDIPLEQVMEHIPMRRIGEPREVAGAVFFLASDEATYINGHVLQVNGGLYT